MYTIKVIGQHELYTAKCKIQNRLVAQLDFPTNNIYTKLQQGLHLCALP